MTAAQQAAVRTAALSWVGTPYRHRQRVKGSRGGVDCAQLLIAVFADAGLITPFDPGNYPPDWHLHVADERYMQYVLRYASETRPPWQIGDVLMFRGRPWPSAGHAAIFVGGDQLVHAVAQRKVELWPMQSVLLAHLWKGFRFHD